MSTKHISRRDFLKITGAAAAVAATGLPLSGLLGTAAAQAATQIAFMGWGGVPEDTGVRAAITVFEKANPTISVDWLFEAGQDTPTFTQTFLSNVAAGTPPDASFVDATNYETFAAKGLLMDITDKVKNDPQLGAKDYFIEPQEMNRCANDQGQWHGIGACWVAPHMYYNADMLTKAGVPLPGFKDENTWDWDTFVKYAKQLTVDANGKHPDDAGFDKDNIAVFGVQWPFSNWTFLASAVVNNGGQFIADGKSGLDSPEAIQALQNLADLIYKHHVAPQDSALTSLGMTNTQMLDSGKLAMAIDGSWALSWMNQSQMHVTLGTAALPKMAKGGTFIQSHFHGALASTKQPDAAWEWVRFLATPFYQSQFCKIGLWLPSQTGLMTPDGIASWITKGIHPDNYTDLLTDYMPKYGSTARIPAGYTGADANFIQPAYQAINNGQAAADVLPDAIKQANAALASGS